MLHYSVVFLVIALVAAVFGFGGIAAGAVEIAKILSRNDSQVTVPPIHLSTFGAGDAVVIKDGAFDGFKGVIHSVDNLLNKVTVLIEIFGRPTPISLESWQVVAE